MKANSILAFLFLLVAGLQTAWGQGFRVYKSDGTVAQFSLRTDSIVFYDGIGTDVDFGPFTPVNQCIAGTWYKTKYDTVTFREDGTTDYMAGATYKFLPYQGTIVIFNTGGVPTNILKVHDVTAEHLIMSTLGSSTFDVLTRTKPVQLVEVITLSKTQFTLSINETQTLTATVSPSDADNKEVEWTSSDESIASVDQSGKVTAKAKGTCTITCAATDGSGMKAECAVTVVQLVTGITLSETTLSLTTGSTHTLTATVVPPTASNTGVAWESSNTSVATVDQSGKVTAKAKGTCTITCSAKDGSGMKAECAVTVIQLVTSITLSETAIRLQPDETKRLTATVVPSNANNPAVTWTSSDDAVATVISNGLVVAVASGICTIICAATDGSGVKAECQVTVKKPDTMEYVDLGLPSGTKWATCNVGASEPEEYGDYFAWGETTPKSTYNWSTYKWCKGSETTKTKYCTQSDYGYNGFTDNLTELQPEDDAATANWGSGWRMPSSDQINELINDEYTTSEWTQLNGVNGRKVTSKSNGNSIFLPAAGYPWDGGLDYAGSRGRYWSSSLSPDYDDRAYYLDFDYGWGCLLNNRYGGQSVRAVRVP